MVCKNPETVVLLDVGASIRERYLQQSAKVNLSFLYEGLRICNEADVQFRTSRNQRLTIELALVQLANLTEVQKKKLARPELSEAPEESRQISEQKKTPPKPEVKSATEKPEISKGSDDDRTVSLPSISIKNSLKTPVETVTVESGETKPPDVEVSEIVNEAKQDFNLLSLQDAWKHYAEQKKDNQRLYTTLINHLPKLGDSGEIRVMFDSQIQSDNFIRNIKSGLSAYLRELFGKEELSIETGINEIADTKKMLYTDTERFEHLVSRNPDLGKLKNIFQLDFDE